MFLRWLAIVCLFCSSLALAWAYWPLPVHEAALPLVLPIEVGDAPITRQALLRFPARLRQGEAGKISLTLTPTADEPAFDGYGLLADAALELPGFKVASAFRQQVALLANHPVRFEWTVTPQSAGTQEGIVPLNMHVFRDTQWVQKTLLSAQPCKVAVSSAFGLDIIFIRLLGTLGSIAGAFLFLAAPHFRKV